MPPVCGGPEWILIASLRDDSESQRWNKERGEWGVGKGEICLITNSAGRVSRDVHCEGYRAIYQVTQAYRIYVNISINGMETLLSINSTNSVVTYAER